MEGWVKLNGSGVDKPQSIENYFNLKWTDELVDHSSKPRMNSLESANAGWCPLSETPQESCGCRKWNVVSAGPSPSLKGAWAMAQMGNFMKPVNHQRDDCAAAGRRKTSNPERCGTKGKEPQEEKTGWDSVRLVVS